MHLTRVCPRFAGAIRGRSFRRVLHVVIGSICVAYACRVACSMPGLQTPVKTGGMSRPFGNLVARCDQSKCTTRRGAHALRGKKGYSLIASSVCDEHLPWIYWLYIRLQLPAAKPDGSESSVSPSGNGLVISHWPSGWLARPSHAPSPVCNPGWFKMVLCCGDQCGRVVTVG